MNHESLLRYAFPRPWLVLWSLARAQLQAIHLWPVVRGDEELLALAASAPGRRRRELRQIRLDRMACLATLSLFFVISWKWTVVCYLPALYLALALVNVQNYYEHYGATPWDRYADSVSHYGRIYNLLTFNDGYHQEHHLRPLAHWRAMPRVYREHSDTLNLATRVVSPVPAILGVFHRDRPLLHRRAWSPDVAAPHPNA